ncbi:hypothetical protein HYC85_012286 [Camellia sinensis]|uniref:SANTA domain-containing protein n=1 Tax=Camellia sinensis TaxID=4442 RepID=A0A7J7HBI3_CAMSI|nr:hypothetical protein HYC85_012286 [Camellia sinensis]
MNSTTHPSHSPLRHLHRLRRNGSANPIHRHHRDPSSNLATLSDSISHSVLSRSPWSALLGLQTSSSSSQFCAALFSIFPPPHSVGPKTSATTISSAREQDPKAHKTLTLDGSKVCLHDWWLIKLDMDSNGRTLGVGGLAFRERQTIRAFYSVAIAKRHDTVTLETADGITITITSFINRSITLENGFPAEVCNHFLFGFPCYWEEYAGRCFVEESINRSIPSRISSFDGFDMSSDDGTDSLPISLSDLPVTRVRDLLMSSVGDSGSCVLAKSLLNDILRKYGVMILNMMGQQFNRTCKVIVQG